MAHVAFCPRRGGVISVHDSKTEAEKAAKKLQGLPHYTYLQVKAIELKSNRKGETRDD